MPLSDWLRSPRRRFAERFEAWLLRRIPCNRLPHRVGARRIYIMPTGIGYAFGVLVFGLWLGAMNYSNSMGFALAFLLAGVGLVGMHMTHANLLGLRCLDWHATPVHAGDSMLVRITLAHDGDRPRPGILVDWPMHQPGRGMALDLHGTATGIGELSLDTRQRGWHPLPPIRLSSHFPLGLFRAWTWMRIDAGTTVYPALVPTTVRTRSAQDTETDGPRQDQQRGHEDFDHLRDYQRGDAPRDVHWKRLARDGQPTVKQFSDARGVERWIDWKDASGDTETRLSWLARQVVDAAAAGEHWGLRLPGTTLPSDTGDAHRHHSLQALAMYSNASA